MQPGRRLRRRGIRRWEPDKRPLPHGLGLVCAELQRGVGGVAVRRGRERFLGAADDGAGRKLTLILMANSDRLVKPLPLAAGDLTVSPFGKLFLSFFVR